MEDATFYHHDALGSVVMLTNDKGHVAESYQYDVYGNAYNGQFSSLGQKSDQGSIFGQGFGYGNGKSGNVYGFTGQGYEPEAGLYAFTYRHYNPQTMRWQTLDPIKDGLNWYEYCGGDPVNWVDPMGLIPVLETDKPEVTLPQDSIMEVLFPKEELVSDMISRKPEKSELQRTIREAPIYQRDKGGNFNRPKIDRTWCNQATYDYAAATSPGLFNAMTGGTDRQKASDPSYLTNANEATQNLETAASVGTIEKVDGATAQSLANQGYTVVAAQENPNGSGHLNTVVLDWNKYDPSLGPSTSDVGRNPGDLRYAEDVFKENLEVSYYYDPEQNLNLIDDSQVLNTWGYKGEEDKNK